jgi:hypothetical protein
MIVRWFLLTADSDERNRSSSLRTEFVIRKVTPELFRDPEKTLYFGNCHFGPNPSRVRFMYTYSCHKWKSKFSSGLFKMLIDINPLSLDTWGQSWKRAICQGKKVSKKVGHVRTSNS